MVYSVEHDERPESTKAEVWYSNGKNVRRSWWPVVVYDHHSSILLHAKISSYTYDLRLLCLSDSLVLF